MEEKNNDPFGVFESTKEKESHLIESLEKKLYSREDDIASKDRTILRPKRFSQTENWEEGSLEFQKQEVKPGVSPFVKFFLFSLTFFVIAALIVGYSLFSKRIVVSPDNVDVSLFGPVSVKGGEDLSVQLLIDNKNNVALNNVEVASDFPEGSKYSSNPTVELKRTVKKLENIEPGEKRTETIKAIVFGQENDKKEITVVVRFGIEGSENTFTKTKKFLVSLTTPPISYTVTSLQETTTGQSFTIGVDVKSNSLAPLSNALFKVEYPKGFVFKSSNPAPSLNNNVWSLGGMKFGDTQHIDITGALTGESDQQKVFTLTAGIGAEKNTLAMETIFSTSQSTVTIKNPFLGVAIFVNGSATEEPIINDWKSGKIGVVWTNSLANKIINGEIEVSLSGDVVNKKSVVPDMDGYYDSFKNTIFWDKRVLPSLASLAPGEKGQTEFNFSLNPYTASNPYKNPEIVITTSVKGTRVDENNVPEAISFFSTKKIKVNTEMALASYGTYYTGPISNTGPIPPKVGNETTYTINWKMANTANDVSGAEMTGVIPLSVRWTGNVYPTGAPITYDAVSHKVTWKIGKVKSGKGYLDDPNEVYFQIGLTPGLSQLDKSPTLLSNVSLTSTDDFTGADLGVGAKDITTVINTLDKKVGQFGIKVVE